MATRAQIWLLCLAVAGSIFVIDLRLPLGVAAAIPYVTVILVSAWSANKRDVFWIAGMCTLLTIAGGVFSRSGVVVASFVFANRGLSIVAIWITALIVLLLRRTQDELAALNEDLEKRVAERAAEAQQRAEALTKANVQLEQEIEQRRKAEVIVRDSQAMYASLVEDLPIPVIRKDRQGRFIFANREFCSWVGREREEVVGQTDYDFFPPQLAEKYQKDDESVLTTGELFLDVEKNEHTGKVNWVHVIKTPARDSTGHIIGTQAIFWDVTARREAEDKLRDSEALYHSLVDTLPLCLLRKDAEERYTFVNNACCEFFNIQPEDWLGKSDFDIFPRDLAEKYHEGDVQVMQTGKGLNAIESIELPDGRRRSIHVIKSAVCDAQDRVVGVQIIFRDVTEELEIESALKESQQRLQAILDNTSAVIYLKDLEGRYRLVNREYETLFGISTDEVIGKTDHDVFPSEFADAFRANDRHVIEMGRTVETEEIAPQPDGPHTYISSKFPLRADDGSVIAVGGISTDITERQRAAQALRESQQRLNLALASAEIGTWHWDVADGTVYWDDRMHDIFGVRRGAFAGNYEAFEQFLHPDDVQRVKQTIEHCLHSSEDFDIDYRVLSPEGNVQYITARAAVLRDEDGQPQRMTGVCLDITARKQAEEQLKRYAERLEASNRELEEFAYIVSHDLQEPLRTLSFFSDSLQVDLGDKLPEQPRRDLEFINAAAGRMQQLVRDLLALSRTGRADLQREEVELSECVDQALAALSTRIRESGATVHTDKLPQVRGDRTLLTQLFQNLISNALKFVGPKPPHVDITAQHHDGAWVIGVRDNGIGIKPEYAKKIFAPFQRLHGQAEYEGTGIGLAICRKVVQRHGGKIWVESQPNEGAHFQFELPVQDEEKLT